MIINKWTTTAAVFLIAFVHASSLDIMFYTLMDLAEVYGKTFSAVSLGVSIRFAGSAIGSLLSAFIFKFANHLIVASIAVIVIGICIGVIAHLVYIPFYYIFMFIAGLMSGPIDSANMIVICDTWKEKASPVIQTLYMTMYVSTTSIPWFARMFLSEGADAIDDAYEIVDNSTLINSTVGIMYNNSMIDLFNKTTTVNASTISAPSKTLVWIPFATIGSVSCIAGVLVLFYEIYRTKVYNKRTYYFNHHFLSMNQDENNFKNQTKFYKYSVLITCSLMVFVFMVMSITFYIYWMPFVMASKLNINKMRAILMFTVSTYAAFVGNSIAFLLSFKIHATQIILIPIFIIILIGNIFLLIFIDSNEVMCYVGVCLITSAIGGGLGSILNSVQTRILMTDRVGSIYTFCYYFATASFIPVLIGDFIEKNRDSFVYAEITFVGMLFILIIVLIFLDKNEMIKKQRKGVRL